MSSRKKGLRSPALEGVEHLATRIRSPEANACLERMNRRGLDEWFPVEERETCYLEPAEIQHNADRFLRS